MDYVAMMGCKDGLTMEEVLCLAASVEGVSNRQTTYIMSGESKTYGLLGGCINTPFVGGHTELIDSYHKFEMVRYFGVAAYDKSGNNTNLPDSIIKVNDVDIAVLHSSRTYNPSIFFKGDTKYVANFTAYIKSTDITACEFIPYSSTTEETYYTHITEGDRHIYIAATSNFFGFKMTLTMNILTPKEYTIVEDFELSDNNKVFTLLRAQK